MNMVCELGFFALMFIKFNNKSFANNLNMMRCSPSIFNMRFCFRIETSRSLKK